MTEFPIYVLGDADSFYHIFNSIAILMNSDFVTVATNLAVMVLMLRVGVAFSKANVSAGAGGTFMAVGVFIASLYPTTTAHIIDVRQQGNTTTYTKIDNLPFALVFIAYGGSSVLASVAPMLDTAFSVIESNKATEIGLGRQPELLASILKTSNLNTQEDDFKMTYFKNAFKIYAKDCAMSTSYIPPAGLDYFIKSPKDILTQIHYDELNIPTMAYTNTTFTDGAVTINKCRDLYDYIENARANIELTLFEKLKKANPDINWDAYSEKIAQGIYEAGFRVEEIDTATGTYSSGLRASMINYALGKTLEDSISNYKYDIPSVANDLANYSVNKSMFSMMTDGMGTVAWINKIAPLVIQYSLLFSYGLFLLVIPVAIGMGYPNAMKILGNYAMGIIALHMGYLAAIIANSIAIFYTSRASLEEVLSIGNNMTAVSAIPYLNQHAAEMAGISGVLLIMAYTAGTAIIFKGETAALQGAMGTIAGRFRNEMMNAAEDMSRKNAYDDAAEQERARASKFIKENGFAPAPIGVGEIEYANSLKRGLEEIGSGLGFARANQSGGSGFEGDYLSGAANKSSSMATSTATFGANTTSQQAIDSGIVQGSTDAGAMIGTASLANRANSLMQGAIFGKQRELSATAEYGDRTISDRAIQAGINEGAMNASKTNASATFGSNELAKGTLHQELQKLQSTATFGANTTSQQAIDSGTVMGTQSAGQAAGMSKALQQEGSDAIKNASQTSSLAQIKDQIQNANTLQSKFGKDLDGKSNSMSYNEMAQAEAEMKLAGRMGSAGGYRALGANAFDMTAENADYGVRSKTLATQAGIAGKGGLESAVAIDEKGAFIKAGKEKGAIEEQAKILEKAMEDGLAKGAKNIAEAMEKISGVTTATQFGKEVGMANKMTKENAESIEAQLLAKKDANGNNMFSKEDLADMRDKDGNIKTGADLASWISGKQAGHLSGMHGLAIGDKTVGLALGDNDVRVGTVDASRSVNTSDMKNDDRVNSSKKIFDRSSSTNTSRITDESTTRKGGFFVQSDGKAQAQLLLSNGNEQDAYNAMTTGGIVTDNIKDPIGFIGNTFAQAVRNFTDVQVPFFTGIDTGGVTSNIYEKLHHTDSLQNWAGNLSTAVSNALFGVTPNHAPSQSTAVDNPTYAATENINTALVHQQQASQVNSNEQQDQIQTLIELTKKNK